MRKLFFILLVVFLVPLSGSAAFKPSFPCTSLTGGAIGDLDYYLVGKLHEGDETHCTVSGEVLHFRFDQDATDAETTATHPYKVRPDDYATAGVWIESAVSHATNLPVEGTEVLSTGEAGATKFLREDGDDTSSWQTPSYTTDTDTHIFENVFYPDSESSDQGTTDGTYLTLFEILATVGATEKAVIVFRHDGTANTTAYNFDTSEVVTANVTVIIEPGVLLSDTTGDETLTIKGPFIAQKVQCFDWDHDDGILFGVSIGDAGRIDKVYPEWWGAVADGLGNTDNQGPIQRAINSFNGIGGVVKFGSGEYEIDGGVTMKNGVFLVGIPPTRSRWHGTAGVGGTFLATDHTATSLITFDQTTGGGIKGIGFREDQGDPTDVGWTVTVYEPTLFLDNGASNLLFEDLFFMNNYWVFYQKYDATYASARLVFRDIFAHALKYGFEFEYVVDKMYFENIHLWPFWTDDTTVWDYTSANGTAFRFERVDNPSMVNVFSWGYNIGFEFDTGTAGVTSNFQGINIEADHVTTGVIVTAATDDTTLHFRNLNCNHMHTDLVVHENSVCVDVLGDDNFVDINGVNIDHSGSHGINVFTGTGNVLMVNNARINNWDQDSAGHAALSNGASNVMYVGNNVYFGPTDGGTEMAGAGTWAPVSFGAVVNNTIQLKVVTATTTQDWAIQGVSGQATGSTNTGVRASATNGTLNRPFADNFGNYSDNSGGGSWVNGSSLKKLKFDIKEFNQDTIDEYYADLDTIPVSSFRMKREVPVGGDPSEAPLKWGLMIDDLPEYLQTEGRDGISTKLMDNYFLTIIQHQKKLITALTQRIEALEVTQ